MKKILTAKGYGMVQTWVSPNQLGGALPMYLSNTKKEALRTAETSSRMIEFLGQTEMWLCEITIKPIKRFNTQLICKDQPTNSIEFSTPKKDD